MVLDIVTHEFSCRQVKRQVKFNPAESETYKALQEESLGDHVQEVTVPPQSRIYAPNKTIPSKVKKN